MILCACPISIPSKFTTIVLPSFKKSATICASLNDADDETEPFDEEYNEVTEEEGYDEEEMEDEEEEPHKPILSLRRKKKDLTESQEDDEDSQSRVIPFHGKEEEGESVKVIRPQTFNEAQIVADFLKEGKTIVVNLEGIEIGQAQRIIDFIGGASFAVDGSLKAISNNIFLFPLFPPE